MAWLLLIVAIVLEVCGTTCMKLSDGFARIVPSVLIFVFYGMSFSVFTLALKRIDVSLAYAVWAGLGICLVASIGIIYFKEPLTALRVFFMLLIVTGVVGLAVR